MFHFEAITEYNLDYGDSLYVCIALNTKQTECYLSCSLEIYYEFELQDSSLCVIQFGWLDLLGFAKIDALVYSVI